MVLLVMVFSFCRLCFKYHPYSSYVFIHGDVICFFFFLWYLYFFVCLAFVGCCISSCCVMLLLVHEVNCSFKICIRTS
jgi:hypothetical protein